MKAFITDLLFAKTAGVCAEVKTLNGDRYLTGVHEVNEEEGFVSLYNPQHMQDDGTTRKVPLDLIASALSANMS